MKEAQRIPKGFLRMRQLLGKFESVRQKEIGSDGKASHETPMGMKTFGNLPIIAVDDIKEEAKKFGVRGGDIAWMLKTFQEQGHFLFFEGDFDLLTFTF
jgi:hypothetical protein